MLEEILHLAAFAVPGQPSYDPAQLAMHALLCATQSSAFVRV